MSAEIYWNHVHLKVSSFIIESMQLQFKITYFPQSSSVAWWCVLQAQVDKWILSLIIGLESLKQPPTVLRRISKCTLPSSRLLRCGNLLLSQIFIHVLWLQWWNYDDSGELNVYLVEQSSDHQTIANFSCFCLKQVEIRSNFRDISASFISAPFTYESRKVSIVVDTTSENFPFSAKNVNEFAGAWWLYSLL